MRTVHTTTARKSPVSPRGAEAPVMPATHQSAHPTLRGVPAQGSVDATATHAASRGATATEVDAVAHLVETFAPEVTVRAVSRRRDVYVVRAAASGRTRLYRIPVGMVPSSGRRGVTRGLDEAA